MDKCIAAKYLSEWTALETEALPFLATSAMMLATLGVQEDWGFSRVGSRGRTPISWIFILASVSAGGREGGNQYVQYENHTMTYRLYF